MLKWWDWSRTKFYTWLILNYRTQSIILYTVYKDILTILTDMHHCSMAKAYMLCILL